MSIEPVLFEALQGVQTLGLPPSVSSSGKKFEDFMVQQVYQVLREQGAFQVFSPRYTLRQATMSGVFHQFDIVAQHLELTAIECKFRKTTGIDDLFAFVGKLVDYREPPHGVFVTTTQKLNDNIFCYAIAHGIPIICLSLPPVHYMIQRVKKKTDLARRLLSLETRLCGKHQPKHLLVEWQNAYRRFVAEGYY